jgi:TolB-like protein
MTNRSFGFLLSLSAVVFLSSCSSTLPPLEKPSYYPSPEGSVSAPAHGGPGRRDPYLVQGVHLLTVRKFDKAAEALLKAREHNHDDGAALFYYATALDSLSRSSKAPAGAEEKALNAYSRYRQLPDTCKYRAWMRNQYTRLLRKRARPDARALLDRADSLAVTWLSPNSIAVFPFTYLGWDSTFETLGRGLCDMMITDLNQVAALEVIERVRMQAMSDEMNLMYFGVTEQIPRGGRLLGARHLVYGTYNVADSVHFSISTRLVHWGDSDSQADSTADSDALANLFDWEKNMVFGLLAKMGVEPTPEEADRIRRNRPKGLDSFQNFCDGVEFEDRGLDDQASQAFERAVEADPEFGGAAERSVSYEPPEPFAPVETEPFQTDLVQERMDNLESGVGTVIDHGVESQSSINSGEAPPPVPDLQDPPRPPED